MLKNAWIHLHRIIVYGNEVHVLLQPKGLVFVNYYNGYALIKWYRFTHCALIWKKLKECGTLKHICIWSFHSSFLIQPLITTHLEENFLSIWWIQPYNVYHRVKINQTTFHYRKWLLWSYCLILPFKVFARMQIKLVIT